MRKLLTRTTRRNLITTASSQRCSTSRDSTRRDKLLASLLGRIPDIVQQTLVLHGWNYVVSFNTVSALKWILKCKSGDPVTNGLVTEVYIGDVEATDQQLFVCERKCFQELCLGLTKPCTCVGYATWKLESYLKVCYNSNENGVWFCALRLHL